MIDVYAYGYVLSYTYIYTCIHFNLKEHEHANERNMVSRSYCTLAVSTTLLRRWFYVNVVPTFLVPLQ